MRKFFTLVLCVASALLAGAIDYNQPMVVSVLGELTDQVEAAISLDEADGLYSLSLTNFSIVVGGAPTNVGNINAEGIKGSVQDGVIMIDDDAHATCTAGTDSSVAWIGPLLLPNGVDLHINAEATEEVMEAVITMNVIGLDVVVYYGPETVKEAMGIVSVSCDDDTVRAVYDLSGKRVDQKQPGRMYLQRMASGRAIKAIAR